MAKQCDGAGIIFFHQGNLGSQDIRRDGQDILGFVVERHSEYRVRRNRVTDSFQSFVFCLRITGFPRGCQRHPPREMPVRRGDFHVSAGLSSVQNFIPSLKAEVHRQGDGHKSLEWRHIIHMRSDVSGQHIGSFLGFGVVPIHARSRRNKVQVV